MRALARTLPVFRGAAETYVADTCQHLAAAAGRREIELRAAVHGHYPGRRLPAGALAGMKTAGYWDAVQPQSWGLPWHRNEGVEFTYLERGTLEFSADDRTHRLPAGHLTITQPWQRHRVGNPNIGPSRLHWLILDAGVRRPHQRWQWPEWAVLSSPDLEELAGLLRSTSQHVWRASPEIRHCFAGIAEAVDAPDLERHLSHLTVRINELLLSILELLRSHGPAPNPELSRSHRTVKLFLDALSSHAESLGEEWTLHRMADSCGLGVTQFIHVVKQLVNTTPVGYLNQRRLQYAAHLLRACPTTTITSIAQDCGFSTSQYFDTVFRRHYGCTPSEFRQNC